MNGSSFSWKLYEWGLFSKTFNIWMGVFWKSQPYVCTQKYRLRLPGVIPLYSSVVGTWNQTIRLYPTENHLCLILPNVRCIGNKKIIYNMMYWDWTSYRALPYSIDSVYRQNVGSEHTQYVSTIWPYKIFFFHLVYRQQTNTL